jgi:hypothetical protein
MLERGATAVTLEWDDEGPWDPAEEAALAGLVRRHGAGAWAEIRRQATGGGAIKEGRTPYFFVHHPDDGLAPAMARSLHRRVYEREPAVGEPPTWPSEKDRSPAAQLDLF